MYNNQAIMGYLFLRIKAKCLIINKYDQGPHFFSWNILIICLPLFKQSGY